MPGLLRSSCRTVSVALSTCSWLVMSIKTGTMFLCCLLSSSASASFLTDANTRIPFLAK